MLLRQLIVSSVALMFVSVSAFAKELSETELRAIQGKMKASESLSVDFVQTSYTSLRKKERKRDGKAAFGQGGKFKWTLDGGEEKIFDGKDFYDYVPKDKVAVRYSPTGPKSYELRQIVDLVLNFDALLKRYDLVKATQDGDVVKVELKPKTGSDITSVDLHLSTKDSLITYVKMNLKNKNYLAHTFKNASTKALPEDTFALPKGVKVTEAN